MVVEKSTVVMQKRRTNWLFPYMKNLWVIFLNERPLRLIENSCSLLSISIHELEQKKQINNSRVALDEKLDKKQLIIQLVDKLSKLMAQKYQLKKFLFQKFSFNFQNKSRIVIVKKVQFFWLKNRTEKLESSKKRSWHQFYTSKGFYVHEIIKS